MGSKTEWRCKRFALAHAVWFRNLSLWDNNVVSQPTDNLLQALRLRRISSMVVFQRADAHPTSATECCWPHLRPRWNGKHGDYLRCALDDGEVRRVPPRTSMEWVGVAINVFGGGVARSLYLHAHPDYIVSMFSMS